VPSLVPLTSRALKPLSGPVAARRVTASELRGVCKVA